MSAKPEIYTMSLEPENGEPRRWVAEIVIRAGEDDERQIWESGFCDSEDEALQQAYEWIRGNQ